MKLTALIPVLGFLFSIIIVGCADDCNIACTENKLECNCCPVLDTTSCRQPIVGKVLIFLETSGSMSGYMPAGSTTTSFQRVIPNVISKLKSSFPTEFYSIKESSQKPVSLDAEQASSQIIKGQFLPWGQNTSIPEMLDTINNHRGESDVTILISDLIYSPQEQKEVGQAVTLISEQFSNSKLTTSILALTSDFNSNKTQTPKAPYYVVIRGEQSNVDEIKRIIFQSLSVYQEQASEVDFGKNFETPYYSVIPYANGIGTWEPVNCNQAAETYAVIKNIESNDSLAFWIGVDLSGNPGYSKNIDYFTTVQL